MSETDSMIAYKAFTKAEAQAVIAPYVEATARYKLPYLALGATNYYPSYKEASWHSDYILKLSLKPIVVTDPVITGVGNVGQTLSSTDGVWRGSGTLSFVYQWTADNQPLEGQNANTLVVPDIAVNKLVQCYLVVTDDGGPFEIAPSNGIEIL
tara:strand:- start:184 stop:642 length:459 start_codon:yes stop_codon:yes gene_type:complete